MPESLLWGQISVEKSNAIIAELVTDFSENVAYHSRCFGAKFQWECRVTQSLLWGQISVGMSRDTIAGLGIDFSGGVA